VTLLEENEMVFRATFTKLAASIKFYLQSLKKEEVES